MGQVLLNPVTVKEENIVLRPMGPGDIGAAVALTRAEGWPHREADWAFHLELGAGWVAEDVDGSIAATLLWWDYGRVATLGLIVVSDQCRGRGLGSRLMRHALERIGSRSLRLVSTRAGFSLYRRFGFEPVGTIEQRQAQVKDIAPLPVPEGAVVRPVTAEDTELLCRMDRLATGADRRRLMAALRATADGLVLEQAGRVTGFVELRRAGIGNTVGPLVATSQADARVLLSHLLAAHPGFTRIDVPREAGALIAWLDRVGLPAVDEVTAMQNRPPEMSRTTDFRTYALVSQAFG